MRSSLRFALLGIALVTAFVFAPVMAHAAPCPAAACITISGRVTGPAGEAVPQYRVLVQRADGYNVTPITDATGRYEAVVPLPSSTQCYQIVGQADAFYANATTPAKSCVTQTVDLSAKVRTQSFSGSQKTYFPDASTSLTFPVEVQALSRSFPAPFDGAAMPWVFAYHDPHGAEAEEGGSHEMEEGERGEFAAPAVTKIADGVWKYSWTRSITLPAGQPGYYDFDWGRGTSAFNPMMECRMYWFGYGADSLTPQRAIAGQTVTITGRRLGAEAGRVVLKGSGQVTVIEGSSIVSWTDSSVTFAVPPLAKTGWASIEPPSRVATNAVYLSLDPVKVSLP